MEGALLLQLMPLLLEDVKGLAHFKLEHEVPDEVIDYHIPAESLGNCLGYLGSFAEATMLGGFLHLCFDLKSIKVIQVVIVFLH